MFSLSFFLPFFLSPAASISRLIFFSVWGCKTGDLTASGTRQNLVRPDCKQRPPGNELLNYLTLVKLDFTARGLAFSILLEVVGASVSRETWLVFCSTSLYTDSNSFFPFLSFLLFFPSRLENKTNFKILWLVPFSPISNSIFLLFAFVVFGESEELEIEIFSTKQERC